jgi:hypothetical protein
VTKNFEGSLELKRQIYGYGLEKTAVALDIHPALLRHKIETGELNSGEIMIIKTFYEVKNGAF